MKQIPLSQGRYAIVDDEDFIHLNSFKWSLRVDRNVLYAQRHITIPENKKRTLLLMHIGILGKKEGFVIDHINGNGLDNRRENLRYVTPRQNSQNYNVPKLSKYPGVTWHRKTSKWQAQITINKKTRYLGLFISETDAFNAYRKEVNKLNQEVIFFKTGGV